MARNQFKLIFLGYNTKGFRKKLILHLLDE